MEKAMRYAYEVYREKSFSQAAKRLYVSQPALSLTIRKLEEDLGLQIFDRTTKPISLTAEGKVYMETAQHILRLTEQLDSYINDRRTLKTGQLTVAAPHLFLVYLLPRIIGKFAQDEVLVDFSLLEGDSIQLREMLLSDKADLIIDTTEYEPDLLVQYKLLEENILLVVPSANPLNEDLSRYALTLEEVRSGAFLAERFPQVPLDRFRNEHFLTQRRGQDMHDRALQLCRSSGFEPQSHLHVNQLITALDLIRRDRGVTFASDTSIRAVENCEGMVFYKLDPEIAHRAVYISYRKNRYVTLAMQKFIQIAVGQTPPVKL